MLILAATTERRHQNDLADPMLYDIFRAQAMWEGAEDLLQSGPFRKLVKDNRHHILCRRDIV